MRKTRKPILVTGSHRSGSTWAGQVLAAAPKTAYIHEPFNIRTKTGGSKEHFKRWFQYISEENSQNYEEVLGRVFEYKDPWGRKLTKVKPVRTFAKIIRDQGLAWWHRISKAAPIVKDPIALFSAEWLSERFNMNVLVMIRHPAAFCSSLKIKDWKFDFNHFLDQPLLMKRYLGLFEGEIRGYAKNAPDIIDQAILLWNCIHHTINIYQEKHSDWLFVRHEDLSLDPINQFNFIYAAFDLEFTKKVRSFILESSGAHNPVEQQLQNEFIRNSIENVSNWKNRLSKNEIDRIKDKTSAISNLFYTEDEW